MSQETKGLRIEVESVELARDKKNPNHIAYIGVRIDPIGIRVGNIRVTRSERRINYLMPSAPRNGTWLPSVTLPGGLGGILRAKIARVLQDMHVIERPTPKEEDEPTPIAEIPMFFNPDEVEENEVV